MIGFKLRFSRMRQGMSQAQLANKLNITVPKLRLYENNYLEPDIPTMIDISDTLHVSLFYLLFEDCDDPDAFACLQEPAIFMYEKGGIKSLMRFEREMHSLAEKYKDYPGYEYGRRFVNA